MSIYVEDTDLNQSLLYSVYNGDDVSNNTYFHIVKCPECSSIYLYEEEEDFYILLKDRIYFITLFMNINYDCICPICSNNITESIRTFHMRKDSDKYKVRMDDIIKTNWKYILLDYQNCMINVEEISKMKIINYPKNICP